MTEIDDDRPALITRLDRHLETAEEFARTAAGRWERGEEYGTEAALISQAYSQLAQAMLLRVAEIYGWADSP